MNVKKVKRRCCVRGCGNTDCYSISKGTEFGGIIICKSCLEGALKAIKSGGAVKASRAPKKTAPLFYHPGSDTPPQSAKPTGAPPKGKRADNIRPYMMRV